MDWRISWWLCAAFFTLLILTDGAAAQTAGEQKKSPAVPAGLTQGDWLMPG